MFESHIQKRRSRTPLLVLGAAIVTLVVLLVPWPYTVTTTYTLEPMSSVEVTAPQPGSVQEVAVQVGSEVKEGDVLARLDTSELTTAHDELTEQLATLEERAERAGLTAARQAVEEARTASATPEELARLEGRLERIQGRRGVAELDEALTQTREALRAAEAQLSASTLTAPQAGTVRAVNVAKGDAIATGKSVAVVEDIRQVKVLVDVPAWAEVQPGHEVTLELGDDRERTFPIQEVPADGRLVLTIDNPGAELRPGTTGLASIEGGNRSILLSGAQAAR